MKKQFFFFNGYFFSENADFRFPRTEHLKTKRSQKKTENNKKKIPKTQMKTENSFKTEKIDTQTEKQKRISK